MAFLTDVKENDVITLLCDDGTCRLAKLEIQIKVSKKTASKVRLSIEADDKIRITKAEKNQAEVKKKCWKKTKKKN